MRDVRAPLERGEAIALTVGAVLLAVSWGIVKAVGVPQCDLRARRESGRVVVSEGREGAHHLWLPGR